MIVGHQVNTHESMELSSQLIGRLHKQQGIQSHPPLVLHADNGGPMRGSTMQVTLNKLGVTASFSRPRVSNDNAHIESLFGTMKSNIEYPTGGIFLSVDAARAWVERFVDWYNNDHLHSAIGFVSPASRHCGADIPLLEKR